MGGALGEALVKRIAFCSAADEINPAEDERRKGREKKMRIVVKGG